MEALGAILVAHDQRAASRFEKIEQLHTATQGAISHLSTTITNVERQSKEQVAQMKSFLTRAQTMNAAISEHVNKRLGSLELAFEAYFNEEEKKNLTRRLDSLNHSVMDLMERVLDPHAASASYLTSCCSGLTITLSA